MNSETNETRRSKVAIPDAGTGKFFLIEPERCTIVVDPKHHLFQPGADKRPPDEGLIRSLMVHGNIEPIKVCPDGGDFLVVVGRRRVLGMTIANERLLSEGKVPHKLQALIQRGSPQKLYTLMIAENAHRMGIPASVQALEIQLGLDHGCSEQDIADAMGFSVQTIQNKLRLLDCAAEVLEALDAGIIGETLARELAALKRIDQTVKLAVMKAEGALKGAKGKAAVRKGTAAEGTVTEGRMRSRRFLERWKEQLTNDTDADADADTAKFVCQIVDYCMGVDNALRGTGIDRLKED